MADATFKPDRFTVEELLTRRYYKIPRFQRPYSWDPTNLEDFWRDCVEDNDLGYFVGPMVGWRKSEASTEVSVVDGQQRLTTLTLALAIVRDALLGKGEGDLAQGVQGYVERRDRDNQPRFVLQPETPAPFLNKRVLTQPSDLTQQPSNDNEKNLARAHAWLRVRLDQRLDDRKATTKAKAVKELLFVRDRLLGLTVIWVENGSEDAAYVVFETLNSRGKDLAVADLLKNLLLSKQKAKNVNADGARDKWDAMRGQLETEDVSVDVDTYIQHWWLSQEKYVAQRKLYRAIRDSVKTRDAAVTRLQSLLDDAPSYTRIANPTSHRWAPEESAIQEALQALLIFGVVQPRPLLLSLLRQRRLGLLAMKVLTPTFKAVENFHFQYNAVAELSSSGGTSARYASYARDITDGSDKNAKAELAKRLRKALSDGLPDPDQFDAAFHRFTVTDEYTREKKAIQYILRRLHESSHAHRPAKPTLEHLLPQSAITDTASAAVVGSIGNLFRFDDDLNNELGQKSFAQKQEILAQHEHLYDVADVLAASEWGLAEIAARGARLAEQARTKTWAMPT